MSLLQLVVQNPLDASYISSWQRSQKAEYRTNLPFQYYQLSRVFIQSNTLAECERCCFLIKLNNIFPCKLKKQSIKGPQFQKFMTHFRKWSPVSNLSIRTFDPAWNSRQSEVIHIRT